jgi:hypothetical protein
MELTTTTADSAQVEAAYQLILDEISCHILSAANITGSVDSAYNQFLADLERVAVTGLSVPDPTYQRTLAEFQTIISNQAISLRVSTHMIYPVTQAEAVGVFYAEAFANLERSI